MLRAAFCGLIAFCCVTFIVRADETRALSNGQSPVVPPQVDLKRLEPSVAQQLESVQTILIEVTSKPDATDKTRAEAYGEFGRLLHAYGYVEEAAICYRQATVWQPDDARWWHLLGIAWETSGKLKEAESALRTAAKLRPEYRATQLRLANVLLQRNRRDEARTMFTDVIKLDPKLAAAHAGAGTAALEDRDYPTAIRHLTQAVELAPAATRLHYSLAMAYRGAGNIDLAREHLRLRGSVGVRADDPLLDELPQLLRGTQVHLQRGKIALAAGAVQDAIREYRAAVKADPDNVTARVNLAVALVQTKAMDEAIEQSEAAVRIEPRNASALFNLASLRAQREDFPAAIALYRTLLEVEPGDLDAHRQLARALVRVKQSDMALQTLQDARSFAPDDEPTTLQLAELLASEEQHAVALKVLTEAHERHPGRGLTSHLLARQLASCPDAKLRDGSKALTLARSVYEARPSFEHAETLAMALAAAERFDDAVKLQRQLIASAEQQHATAVVQRLAENLHRYEKREAARERAEP